MNKQIRRELMQFFGLSFAFSWLVWLPGVLSTWGVIGSVPIMPLILLGALGPAVTAVLLTARAEGRPGLKRLAGSAFNPRRAFPWLLGASALLLLLHAGARLIYALTSSNLPVSAQAPSPLAALPFFVVVFFIGGGLDEEIGWRGYALDRLQTRYSALTASLILSVLWIVWHLPTMVMAGTNQSLIPFWLFALAVLPLGVMLTWVYNSTHSIFAAAFFHALGNTAHELFVVHPTADSPALTGMIILTVLYYVTAVFLVWRYGPQRLAANNVLSIPQISLAKRTRNVSGENRNCCGSSGSRK